MKRFTSIQQVLSLFHTISTETLAKNAEWIDENYQWPEESLRRIQHEGLAGLVIPSEYGGLGHGLLALAQSCEILGQECASTSMCFGMHCVGAAVIAAKATPYQVEKYLRPITEGKHLTTIALSEPHTGSHFYFPESQVSTVGHEEFEITGKKSFVTNGRHADSYITSAVTAEGELYKGRFSCWIVPADAPQLNWSDQWKGLGMRGNSSCGLELNQVKVFKNNLLGEEGDQLWYIFEIITPYFLMSIAGTYLGMAEAALKEVTEHLHGRYHSHSGKTLSKYQLQQYKLGLLWGQVERTRRLIYSAASAADEGRTNSLLTIFSAKAEVAETVNEVIAQAMTMLGGLGYAKNSKIGRMMRDARAAHVMAPSTDTLRIWTGRALLGLPILGDD